MGTVNPVYMINASIHTAAGAIACARDLEQAPMKRNNIDMVRVHIMLNR